MISYTMSEATNIWLGNQSSNQDRDDFWGHFKNTACGAHFDTHEQANVKAYNAYQAMGWDWPFGPIEGA